MATARKWLDEEVVALLEIVQSHEYLYDVTHPQYRDRKLKLTALHSIATRIGNCSAGDISKKIKNLRTQYAHEKKKLCSRTNNGEEIHGDRISKWKFFESLKFMDASITQHDTQADNDNKSMLQITLSQTAAEIFSDTDVPDHDESSEELNVNRSSILSHAVPTNICTPSISTEYTHSVGAMHMFMGSSVKRKRLNDDDKKTINEILLRLSKIEDRFPPLEAEDDDCSTFGKFIAYELRRMDSKKRQLKKQELCNVLFS